MIKNDKIEMDNFLCDSYLVYLAHLEMKRANYYLPQFPCFLQGDSS